MPNVENETGDTPEELQVVEVAPGDFRRLNAADRKAMAEQIKATKAAGKKDTGPVTAVATTTDTEVPLTPAPKGKRNGKPTTDTEEVITTPDQEAGG